MPPHNLTKQGLVVERLRTAILEEELQPGAWLRLRDLAQLLQTSTMPVREALQALAGEGLVSLYPHRGAQVAPLSVDELEELYMARLGLEGLAARLAAEQIKSSELRRLRELLPALETAVAESDIDRFLALDAESMISTSAPRDGRASWRASNNCARAVNGT